MSLITREAKNIDPPNYNELQRAKELASSLRLALQRLPLERFITLPRGEAEELCQLLHDSLKTAEQLRDAE